MRCVLLILIFIFSSFFMMTAQNTITGVVMSEDENKPLENVRITIKNTKNTLRTNKKGEFNFHNIPKGNYYLFIDKKGFEKQTLPILLISDNINLGVIYLSQNNSFSKQDISVISLTDEELNDETVAVDNITGLLNASKNIFLQTAAYQWSSSFFRVKGLDSKNANILINGVLMNKFYNGRPNWSNWGGLNDVTRNQRLDMDLAPSYNDFGGVLGSTNINMRASEYGKKGSISYASSNRSYTHRLQAYYSTGILKNNWSFAFSASSRLAKTGYNEGTPYQANSFMISAEKKLNKNHSINITGIYADNKRGKNSPNTQEVYKIKGNKYNPYWGIQQGKIRNARIRKIQEPFLIFSHYWNVSDNTQINTNIAYQQGEITNSRIDYTGSRLLEDGSIVGGAINPDPTYYSKLPSFGIKNNTNNAYELLKKFQNNGQINWEELYRINAGKQNSNYIIYQDVNADKIFSVNSIISSTINDNIIINGKIAYRTLNSENFARLNDLLGGKMFLDVNPYGNSTSAKQYNLENPNKQAKESDIIKYHYDINTSDLNAFTQGQFIYKNMDAFISIALNRRVYQRTGFFRNGSFADNSFGKSARKIFILGSAKAGMTYKISGRHLLNGSIGYFKTPPTLQNTFSNPRVNNNFTKYISPEKTITSNISYTYRGIFTKTKLTAYYTTTEDAIHNTFFYANGLDGDLSAFVQQSVTGINKTYLGLELGGEINLTSDFKLKFASNIAQYVYSNNPILSISSEEDKLQFKDRTTFLKNYRLPVGPQKAYSLGFQYRSPEYWWLSITANYFDDAYISIAPLKRTSNFLLDTDGIPFNNYHENKAREILKQEKFDGYFVCNLIGGKSWRIADKKYLGFFININNLLNKSFKSGGFEQIRTANYKKIIKELEHETPVFGNKYWLGRGVTYFTSVYYRF